jgi:hypothetical protein
LPTPRLLRTRRARAPAVNPVASLTHGSADAIPAGPAELRAVLDVLVAAAEAGRPA